MCFVFGGNPRNNYSKCFMCAYMNNVRGRKRINMQNIIKFYTLNFSNIKYYSYICI